MKKNFFFLLVVFLYSCTEKPAVKNNIRNISGIYPHLAMFNSAGECGQGAVVPWAGRLWVITYGQHYPYGSDDKLYEIDDQLNLIARRESTGGTPANRMIHRASKQLIIGPYFIDEHKKVRVIPYKVMPGRLTATAAHLTDPENRVYMVTMEEGFYEVNVHNLKVHTLFPDGNTNPDGNIDQPWLPGYHGKGAYTSQGLLVYSNNGELSAARMENYDGPAGCLGAWDGKSWKVIERRQFTEVTGPGGIYGNASTGDPLWSLGWDKKSVILKLLDNGSWYTFRLPKASFTYGGKHGWYTEWPRIREINSDRLLMTMFGMFWQFPKTFTAQDRSGIQPLSSYLKMVVDFAFWNGRIVFGCDDTSLFDNPYAGQAQSNLWFVKPEDLRHLGPASGYGAVWLDDTVKMNKPSDPYLTNGSDHILIHLVNDSGSPLKFTIESDRTGNNHWETYRSIHVPPHGYKYHIFPDDFRAQWIRLKTDRDSEHVTSFIFTTQNDSRSNTAQQNAFESLPHINGIREYSFGLIRPDGHNRGTLQFAARKRDAGGKISKTGYYEVDGEMTIKKVSGDTSFTWLEEHIPVEADFSFDRESAIIRDKDGFIYRLPSGDTSYFHQKNVPTTRGLREVVTERSLLNCQGTFYEIPRKSAGGYAGMKPVCTHNRIIYDFCSWRGMLVISGNLTETEENGHYIKSTDRKTGLWFGNVDDLWKLGKPHGMGGPWLNTQVKAGEPSDPYLMTGFDKKTLTLYADNNVNIKAEICMDPYLSDWHLFKVFPLKATEKTIFAFPDGYEAHWIRFKADKNCRVTAWLNYE